MSKKLVQSVVSGLLAFVMLATVMFVGLPPQSVAASAPVAPNNVGVFAPQPNLSDFAKCIVADIKILPKAKKLSPQGYQDLEKMLNNSKDLWNLIKSANPVNKYLAAVMLGVKLGKFIGYDLIWYIGMVQDCWPQIKRR